MGAFALVVAACDGNGSTQMPSQLPSEPSEPTTTLFVAGPPLTDSNDPSNLRDVEQRLLGDWIIDDGPGADVVSLRFDALNDRLVVSVRVEDCSVAGYITSARGGELNASEVVLMPSVPCEYQPQVIADAAAACLAESCSFELDGDVLRLSGDDAATVTLRRAGLA